MATTANITTNFVGEVAGQYIAEMIKEANTISENLVTVLPNVVSPQFVRKIETTTGFIDYACGWAPAGSITLTEKELAPKKIKWDSDFCKEDFRQLWTAQEMGFSAHNDNLPATEQAGLDLIPDALFGSDGFVYGVSTDVIRALKRAYGTQARSNGTFLNPSEFDFEGTTLTEIKGLPASHMVAYNPSQVFFGTGLLSDMNEVKIKDMDESDLSGQIRFKLVMTGGVQYAYGGEVILYGI